MNDAVGISTPSVGTWNIHSMTLEKFSKTIRTLLVIELERIKVKKTNEIVKGMRKNTSKVGYLSIIMSRVVLFEHELTQI